MNYHRLTWVAFAVAALSVTVARAQSDTNQIMGHLGYPVGTTLMIEGKKVEPYKGYGFDVWKVNGRTLGKPIRITLVNIVHRSDVSTNTVCQFKGEEVTLNYGAIWVRFLRC